jgi:hypothetical protein
MQSSPGLPTHPADPFLVCKSEKRRARKGVCGGVRKVCEDHEFPEYRKTAQQGAGKKMQKKMPDQKNQSPRPTTHALVRGSLKVVPRRAGRHSLTLPLQPPAARHDIRQFGAEPRQRSGILNRLSFQSLPRKFRAQAEIVRSATGRCLLRRQSTIAQRAIHNIVGDTLRK